MIPTTWNKLVVICLLAGLCLLVAACGRAAEPVDEGPNAHLSNDELLAIAVENMHQAESYNSVFRGGIPSDAVKMSQSIAITAEVQPIERGNRITIRDEAEPETVTGPNPDSVDLRGGAGVDVLYTAKESYHSYDGGETWTTWGVDTPQDYLFVMFVPVWKVHEERTRPSTRPSIGGQLVKGLTFRDGTPRLEVIDGATTRHMVAQREPTGNEEDQDHIYGFGPLPTGTINLWVSTDITPTIRQMHVASTNTILNEDEQPTETPYTLHWKWSRFNEDFGKVEPPPPDTIKPPY
ncbi:MAG TPA: hypothetical protein VF952_01355 [Chloroflexia bacterium]